MEIVCTPDIKIEPSDYASEAPKALPSNGLPEVSKTIYESIPNIKIEPADYASEMPEASPLIGLPEKSKKTYVTTYEALQKWKQLHDISDTSESVMLLYFKDLSAKYKPTTLWTTYSILKRTINLNEGINIKAFRRLQDFLKDNSESFQPKQANVFSPDDIKRYLHDSPIKDTPVVELANHSLSNKPINTKRNANKMELEVGTEEQLHKQIEVSANHLTNQDELDIFGKMVAAKIRKLNRRNQAIAQNRIQNCLFRLEMEELNSSHSNGKVESVSTDEDIT